MTDLLTYIKTLNAETLAWVAEDSANRWAGTLVEDLDHWAGYGITTPSHLKRYLDECAYSDGYKEVYGRRPRFVSSMSDAALADALAGLEADAIAESEAEEYYASIAVEAAKVEEMNNPAPLAWEAEDLMYS